MKGVFGDNIRDAIRILKGGQRVAKKKIKQCSKCGCDIPMSKEMAEVIDHSITAPLLCGECARADAYINKTDGKYHPTQKLIQLFQRCLESLSEEGETILDPFMGSGTTLLACKKLNRKCIGLEIEEKYCEIAAKRCSQGVMKLDI